MPRGINNQSREKGEAMNEIKTGYKATDQNMCCRGFQFVLGEWHKHDGGELKMYESGFHFCEYKSGIWSFYPNEGTRVFKVEAKNCILGSEPGADMKHVAMEIRLVEEIIPAGDGNTGDRNTGDGNSGDRNAGDGNSGNRNAGSRNSGNWNAGTRNAGDRNTGDGNSGNWNTGTRNAGGGNTGTRNAGDGNSGDGNAGNGNATDSCSGHLCRQKQPVVIFDKAVTEGAHIPYRLINELSSFLEKDDNFDIEPFLSIPNATREGIVALHAAHIARRKVMSSEKSSL